MTAYIGHGGLRRNLCSLVRLYKGGHWLYGRLDMDDQGYYVHLGGSWRRPHIIGRMEDNDTIGFELPPISGSDLVNFRQYQIRLI